MRQRGLHSPRYCLPSEQSVGDALLPPPRSAAQPSPRFTFLNRAGQLPLQTSLQLAASAVKSPGLPGPRRIPVRGLEGGPARRVHPLHDKSHWRRRAGAVLMRGGTERDRGPRKSEGRGQPGTTTAWSQHQPYQPKVLGLGLDPITTREPQQPLIPMDMGPGAFESPEGETEG